MLTSKTDIVVVVELVDGLELTTDVEVLGGVVEVDDSRVLWVSTEDKFTFLLPVGRGLAGVPYQILLSLRVFQNLLVRLVDVLDGDDSKVVLITEVTESDTSTRLDSHLLNVLLGDVEVDWHREEVSVNETGLSADTVESESVYCTR